MSAVSTAGEQCRMPGEVTLEGTALAGRSGRHKGHPDGTVQGHWEDREKVLVPDSAQGWRKGSPNKAKAHGRAKSEAWER